MLTTFRSGADRFRQSASELFNHLQKLLVLYLASITHHGEQHALAAGKLPSLPIQSFKEGFERSAQFARDYK
jgi:hypothetical protein